MSATFDAGTQRLIDDLLGKPQSFARDEILARAKRLYYHDYKSPYAAPEGVLAKHLTFAGFPDLAVLVLDDRYSQKGTGEAQKYAEETEEGRELEERVKDPAIQEMAKAFFEKASDPKLQAAARAYMIDCIRTKRFKGPMFDDRKVRDPRKAN